MADDPLGIGISTGSPESTTTAKSSSDPLGLGIKKADTSLPDSYAESSKANPDHVSSAQEISKRRGIDPNYTLANIDQVKKADDAPDFDLLKSTNPKTHKLISDPTMMGKAWDDIKTLQEVEGHAQAGKKASSLLQAALAGFQGSGTGMSLRAGLPDVVLGPEPPLSYELASGAAGVISDLPQMILGGAGGAVAGPVGAGAGGFALPAAYREFVRQQYTHGNARSVSDLLRRAVGIAIPASKQAAVGIAMTATGGGAAALGAGAVVTKAVEAAAMTAAGAAVEGKYPTARDLALNGIMLAGAHVAGITWDRMGESAQASKLRARDPQAFADHADNVSEPRSIPVEKWDAVLGPDAEDMANRIGAGQAYKAAKAGGGDLELTAGQMLSAEMDKHREAFKDVEVEKAKDEIKAREEAANVPTPEKEMKYVPMPNLSEEQRSVETKFATFLNSPKAIDEYAKLPESMGGKLLDVDVVRSLSEEYAGSKEGATLHSLSTHRPASAWVKRQFAERMAEPATGPVLFFSGGGGSGKSTIRNAFDEIKKASADSDIILDGTLAKESVAIDQIEKSLESGRNVIITHVYRPFESAVASVVNRYASQGGRWVPSEVLANDHVMSQETFNSLARRYADNPNVKFRVYENPDTRPGSAIAPREITLAEFQDRRYNKDADLSATIARLYETARKANEVPEREAQALANKSRGNGSEDAERTGRSDAGDFYARQGPQDRPSADAVAPPTPLEEREQATSRAVESANQEIGQSASPVQGIDPKLQAELDKMRDAASKEAEKMLLKPQLEELKARNRALIDAERERATADIGNQVGNEPVFRAFSLFNPEGADHEISQKTIWKKSHAYINDELSHEDALHFEAVSEMSGFSSADEMARKLLTTERGPAFQAEVKSRLDQHMAQFADLKDTEAMQAEALRVVHNEKSGELLALQYQFMEGMAQSKEINAEFIKERKMYAAMNWEQAKQLARDTINSRPAETAGRFRAYFTAERNAAVRAAKAEKAGDFQEAAQARSEQLNNHALAAESLRIRDGIERWHDSIVKQQRAEPATWKDQDHFFQAAQIMDRFGFEREDYDPSKRAENLQGWAARMDEKTGAVEIPAWLQDEGISKDWRKLTPSELRDVRNALKNIKHVANAENEMFSIRRGEGIDAIAADLHDAKIKNANHGKTPGAGTYQSNWQKLTHAKDVFLNNLISPDTFMSELDGFKMTGPWQDTLIATKDKAMDARGEMNAADAEKWRDIHSEYTPKELRAMRSKPLYIPELDPKGQFTKDNLLTIAANQGSEGNQTMLREGRGWTQEQVDSALSKHLDKRDWDLVQAKLDWMESRKPAMAALHKRVTGFEPTWVDAKPIQTPFGEYRGGYYPLISDPRVVSRGFENMKVDAALNDPPVTFKAATQQGFLKARNQNARYAVSLDGSGFVRHMSDVTHDLTMREWVIDASRILGDKGVARDVQDAFGMENYQGMKQWLKQIAGNDVKPLREAIDGIVSSVRRRSTVSQLGGKLSVMFSQIHGLTAAASVDPDNFGRMDVAAGIMNVYGKMLMNPSSLGKTLELVDGKSAYMHQSGMDADRDISEAARSTHGGDANVMQFAQKGFKLMHDLTMKPLWLQAYKVGLRVHEGSEEAAVAYADKIIKGSTTGGRASDLPALMRNGETGKLITMFHGFVNAQTQLMYKAYGRVHSAADVSAFAGTYMNVMVLPGAMYALFHYGLPNDQKSQKMWQKALIRSASPLSMVPIVSTLQDWAIDRALGIPGHASMSPAGGGIDALYDLFQESTSRRAHTQKVIERAAKVASYTGLPIPGPMFMQAFPDQYNTWLFNTVDAVHNGMTPRASDLMKRRPARERAQ